MRLSMQKLQTCVERIPKPLSPKSIEEAFLIQDAVLEKRGREIAAWKVGQDPVK